MLLGTRFPSAPTLGAFAVTVVLGAGNFIGVGFSNRELDPFWGAALRFGLAAAIFALTAWGLHLRWPRGRELGMTVVYGALGTGAFFALMYWARLQVSAGAATVVMAVVPLATVVLAAAQGLERWRLRGLAGALLACAGIAWIAIGPEGTDLPIGALLAMLGAAAAVAQSVIVGKRLSGNHPVMTNAVGMTVGALMLFALSAAAGETWALPRQRETIWALGYLIVLGTVGLFVLLLLVVRRWTASATSYTFVLFPVVTMVLDWSLFDEPLTARMLAGALVVMAGVWFGALSPAARRSARVAPPVAPGAPDLPPRALPASRPRGTLPVGTRPGVR